MKKFLFAVLCIILATNCTAFSVGNGSYDYVVDDTQITVEFASDSALSAEKQQQIADYMVHGDDGASTYAWCWLTGHDYITENVITIEHKVYTSVPRCIRKIYSVETCSKCDHLEETLLSQERYACCAAE